MGMLTSASAVVTIGSALALLVVYRSNASTYQDWKDQRLSQIQYQPLVLQQSQLLKPRGLRNIGNTCFLNSVLQALASLPSFLDHLHTALDRCGDKPVTHALHSLCCALNGSVAAKASVLRPTALIDALTQTSKNRMLLGYQQQDAHELFQWLSCVISSETEESRIASLKQLKHLIKPGNGFRTLRVGMLNKVVEYVFVGGLERSPLTGLIASHIQCLTCGYSSPKRLATFDNLSLVVSGRTVTTLEQLISQYCQTEEICGYICDKCSLRETQLMLKEELRKQNHQISQLKAKLAVEKLKKRKKSESPLALIAAQMRVAVTRAVQTSKDLEVVESVLCCNQFEVQLPPTIRKVKKESQKCLKSVSIEYLPQCICFHMQRSIFLPSGHIVKSNARVIFTESLVLPSTGSFKYRLQSFVLHYGNHDSGHFITYRRHLSETSNAWVRISDESVEIVHDIQAQIVEHASQFVYMAFYERVKQ